MNIAEMHSWFDILQDKGNSPYFTTDEKTQFLNRAQMKFVNETLNKFFYSSAAQPEKNATAHNTIESIQAGEDALAPLIGALSSNNAWVYDTTGGGLGHDNAFFPVLDENARITQSQLDYYVQGMLKQRNSVTFDAHTWRNTSVMSIINLTWLVGGNNIHFRYARQQDIRKMMRNSFTQPLVQDPVYYIDKVTEQGRNWKIQPAMRPTVVANTVPANITSIKDLWYDASGVKYTFATFPAANRNALSVKTEVIRTPLQMHYEPSSFEVYPTAANVNVSCELPDFTHDEIMAIALDDAGVATRDQALVQLNQAAKTNITPQ